MTNESERDPSAPKADEPSAAPEENREEERTEIATAVADEPGPEGAVASEPEATVAGAPDNNTEATATPSTEAPGEESAPEPAATEPAADETPAADDQTPAADDQTPAADDQTPAADDQTPAADDQTPAAADETPAEAPAAEQPSPEAEVDAEPMTMAELMDQPDNEVKSLKHGDVVEGRVVRIDPDEILVDFGGKSEGVVSNRELMSRRTRDGEETGRPELKVDDEVLVYVLQPESPEGHAVLSLRRAGLERKWRGMQEKHEAGEIVEARVIDHNKGGLIVDLGVRGFVPISQIVDFPRRPRDEQPRDAAQEIAEKLQPFVGRTLRLKILEVNRKANRLILSEKVALYEERREKRDELFSSLQVGQRVKGVVRSIAPFGVFVDLGGIDGLVHKSELSWNKVNNPETAHAIGEEVEAEVIDINHERGRISLSIRRLQPDPWQESVAKYSIGDLIEGTVTKLVNFGAFVRVEEGLEGLIHISELSHSRVAHPGDVVKEGDQVKLKIISLDSDRHRLGLSLKQTDERPEPAPAAPTAPRDERPQRRERRERRDRFEYRPEDATSEPEGGIDNTMAAAFAESGLLEQFRASQAAREQEQAPAEEASAEAETAEAPPAEEASAEAETAEAPTPEEPAAAQESAERAAPAEASTADAPADEAAAEEAPAEKPAAEGPAEEEPEAEASAAESEEPQKPDKGAKSEATPAKGKKKA